MKLLLDQNLSRRLVGLLADGFPDSTHDALVGLDTASDREIWSYAAAFLHGPPPKVIWLRVEPATEAVLVLPDLRPLP